MVTPELLAYIKGELAKGRTREDIQNTLRAEGGWTENDFSEAFRTMIPMQGVVLPDKPVATESSEAKIATPAMVPPPLTHPTIPDSISPFSTPSPYTPSPSLLKQESPIEITKPSPVGMSSLLKFLVVLIILGGLGFGGWYYRTPIISYWNNLRIVDHWDSAVASSEGFFINSWNSLASNFKKLATKTPESPVVNNVKNNAVVATTVKNCGTSIAPKLDTPSLTVNDPVLACLGASALHCENATGVLENNFFPTIFEITKSSNSCNFKLSYAKNSALSDVTGKKLASQFVSCPLGIVKAVDTTNPAVPKFINPNLADMNKYGSEIYFYGSIGLFLQNNLDKSKIQNLGCSGSYIDTMIASYNLKK